MSSINEDSTDPEDIRGLTFKYSEINLEKKEELRPETQLISQWISECKVMEKTSKLNFCQKAKIYSNMKAQFKSSEVDSTDPEDILGSLTPSYEKNPSKYSEINLEKKEELCPETQLISQWISECQKIEQKNKLNFFQKAKIYSNMKAQFKSSKV